MNKLDVKAFALAAGILWGGSLFILTWLQIGNYGSVDVSSVIKTYYIGYSVTPIGSVVGAVYGFFDVGIACAIFALLYNLIAKK
ncbi:MAG: hypothetical protein HQ579_02180 [Candidatus Omnitrophica bacterium]|nr:hypothetical protein [Candidatus Omnitrophota bacterium]